MPLNKPYKRIYREMFSGSDASYSEDVLYASDRLSCIHSYHLLEKDVKVLFDYIAPDLRNEATFSHRIYELFFRACTEFENNARAILEENNYTRSGYWNITDYFKVNQALYLDRYEIRLNMWANGPLILKPFQSWNTAARLTWYQDYNLVKHNRTANFHLANLKNLLDSMAGLMSILYAQFAHASFSPYQPIGMVSDDGEFESANDSLFEIKSFKFPDADKYDFDWKVLKTTASPLNIFQFV